MTASAMAPESTRRTRASTRRMPVLNRFVTTSGDELSSRSCELQRAITELSGSVRDLVSVIKEDRDLRGRFASAVIRSNLVHQPPQPGVPGVVAQQLGKARGRQHGQ